MDINAYIAELAEHDGFFRPFVGNAKRVAKFRPEQDIKMALFPEHVAVQEIHDTLIQFSATPCNIYKEFKTLFAQQHYCECPYTQAAYEELKNTLCNKIDITPKHCVAISDILDALLFLPGNILHAAYVSINSYLSSSVNISSMAFPIRHETKVDKPAKRKEKAKANIDKLVKEAARIASLFNGRIKSADHVEDFINKNKSAREKKQTEVRKTARQLSLQNPDKFKFHNNYVNGKLVFDGDALPK